MLIPPDIEAFVASQRVGRLATVDAAGRPHVVPVCFVLERDTVYSVLDAKPKRVPVERLQRVRNLLANPNVQLLVDRYEEDWTRLAFVQFRGRATLLLPGPEQAVAVKRLREKYSQYESMDLDESPVIAIEVVEVVSWGELSAGSDQHP